MKDEIAELLNTGASLAEILEYVDKLAVRLALGIAKGNISNAAKLLGVHRNSLHRRIREHRIDTEEFVQPGSRTRSARRAAELEALAESVLPTEGSHG